MNHAGGPLRNPTLCSLAADLARLCHAQKVELSSGAQTEELWSGQEAASSLVAALPIGAGSGVYELRVLDSVARPLNELEQGAFQAFVELFRRELECHPPIPQPSDPERVVDHVALALDYVTDSFILLDTDWMVEHVNAQFERIVGRRRSELINRNLWQAIPEMLGTRFESEARATMGTALPRVFEESCSPWGRCFECRAFPCQQGLAVLMIDTSERRAEEQARADRAHKRVQAQRMESLGTLASGIAHDFNNILGAILGHVGLLRQQLPAGSPLSESVEQIGIAGVRARDLVQGILAFSRETRAEFVWQPLRPLIEEGLRLFRATLTDQVSLDQSFTDEPLCATLNPSEVHQLVLNLCTNAWQALHGKPGRIKVELSCLNVDTPRAMEVGELAPGRYAAMAVTDTGCGIASDTKERIFEPFFTTKPRGLGTGLGLHMVHSIVSAHGGAISVESRPGQGSTFRVCLPAGTQAGAARASTPVQVSPRGHGEHVAYVDDDEVVRLMVERLLQRAGFEVTTFTLPQAFLSAIENAAACFDLLITDYSMPMMDGLELARQARQSCPGMPVILSSGFVSDELRALAAEAGVVDILNKENTFEELAMLVVRALQRPSRPEC